MARTKGSSAESTRPAIRAAAATLFAEDGYQAVTMRRIGAEAGLRAGALYRYFPDKESLALDLLEEAVAERDRALDAATGETPLASIEGFVHAYLQWHMASGGGAGLIALVSQGLGRDARAAVCSRLDGLLTEAREAGEIRVPDSSLATRAILALLDEVAADQRLPEHRRLRIGGRFVRRLLAA
jgi:AcrR family transcriptional regulator